MQQSIAGKRSENGSAGILYVPPPLPLIGIVGSQGDGKDWGGYGLNMCKQLVDLIHSYLLLDQF